MHRWLSTDCGRACFRCGVAVDYAAGEDGTLDGSAGERAADNRASMLIPPCSGPDTARAHHYQYVGAFGGALTGVDSDYLDCAYGDATIRPDDDAWPAAEVCRRVILVAR